MEEEKKGQESKPRQKRKYSKITKIQKDVLDRQTKGIFAKWKGLNAAQMLIFLGKAKGKSDEAISKELGCAPCTVTRERRKYEKSDWFEDMVGGVLDLGPLWLSAMRFLLMKPDAYATVMYGKGTGLLRDRTEVTYKVEKQAMQEKFKERVNKLLGVKAKEQLAEIGVDLEKTKDEEAEKER